MGEEERKAAYLQAYMAMLAQQRAQKEANALQAPPSASASVSTAAAAAASPELAAASKKMKLAAPLPGAQQVGGLGRREGLLFQGEEEGGARG